MDDCQGYVVQGRVVLKIHKTRKLDTVTRQKLLREVRQQSREAR